RVVAKGREIRLTPKEFDLLHYLVVNPNLPIPHARLLHAVWGPDYGDQVQYLRVFVNQLRKKIEPDPSHPRYILTEPWVGYKFAAPEEPAYVAFVIPYAIFTRSLCLLYDFPGTVDLGGRRWQRNGSFHGWQQRD